MTAFCLSSTRRSRPSAFTVFAAREGDFENVPEPVRSSSIVDTPKDELADRPPANDPSSLPRPETKHPSDQERGSAP